MSLEERKELPILILHGASFCYNILNEMAYVLQDGLISLGYRVEMCDLSENKKEKLVNMCGKKYRAVIGVQMFISNIFLAGQNCYLTDFVLGPKLEIIFDHPFWFYDSLVSHGKDFYTLTHDENYVKFIENYGKDISGSYLLPPAGIVKEYKENERDLDVVFLGTYNNYREKLQGIYAAHGQIRRMAARYLKYLREDVNEPAEYAFEKMLNDYGIFMGEQEFPEWMCKFGDVCQCMMYYYREKIIRTLLDAKITLHVYGDTWKNSPFADSKYLIVHEAVVAGENNQIFERAKISLNILAWHKGGCNERIIHSMQAGAVVVTDKSSYIEKNFKYEEELFYFDLKELNMLPHTVKRLLRDENLWKCVSENGRKKANREYSSIQQARRLLEIIEDIEKSH